MNFLSPIFARGVAFVRNNPQIMYTLFLVVAIPVAFFFTIDQFRQIAVANQDRLEYDRISFLQDGFALFASLNGNDSRRLMDGIAKIAKENETMINFRVLGVPTLSEEDDRIRVYPIIAAFNEKEVGQTISINHSSNDSLSLAFSQSSSDMHHSHVVSIPTVEGRAFESIRSFPETSTDSIAGYLVTDFSLANADAFITRKMIQAYAIALLIIIMILGLLARQARILDYATLYARLEEVDKMKDDFVSMAAHELRSPLTVIRGYVDMIGSEGLSEERQKHLHLIDQAASQLNLLVGDILDVAKLQEGRMSFSPQSLDISEILADTVNSFKKPAEDKGLFLSLEKQTLSKISVDPDRFRQVLVNLLGNAIKYTPSGEVKVIAEMHSGFVVIRVSDTGLGMTAEEQERLFQKFYRVKSKETERITGTGLGLWITESIVKAMNGTISVESIKGKGTDFVIHFPVVK